MKIPEVTRKPYNTRETAWRFAAGLGRPDKDTVLNVGISDRVKAMREKPEYFITYESYGTPIALMSEDLLTMWVVSKTYSSSTSSHKSALWWPMRTYGWEETTKASWRPDMANSRWYRSLENIEYVLYKRSAKDRDRSLREEAKKIKANTRKSAYVPVKERPGYVPGVRQPRQKTQWYKVLTEYGEANHGGIYIYDLPTYDEEKGAWIPGAWTEPIPQSEIAVCFTGYHVTDEPARWMFEGCTVWKADVQGRPSRERDKAAFCSIRCTEPVPIDEAWKIKPIRRKEN